MVYWPLIQQNSVVLLGEGVGKLVTADSLSPDQDGPEAAGSLAFIKDGQIVYASGSANLRKSLNSQRDPRHSEFYKSCLAGRPDASLSIDDYSLKYIETGFGRLELATYAQGKSAQVSKQSRHDLWNRVQLTAAQLIEEGSDMCQAAEPVRWGSAARVRDAGIYMIRDQDKTLLYIGASDALGAQYRLDGSSTYDSVFRRNLGERILRYRLQTVNGEKRYFFEDQDRAISDYIRGCSIAFQQIALGRIEILEYLIETLRPPLNDYVDRSPFARRQPEPAKQPRGFATRLLQIAR